MLRISFWRELLKCFAILMLLNYLATFLDFAQEVTCDKSVSPTATAEAQRQAAAAAASCHAVFAPITFITLSAWFACCLYWAWFVGGPRRKQLRDALGIPSTDANGACCCHNDSDSCNSDCCVHFWCTCCAIAQETRTILQVELEEQQKRLQNKAGYVPLIEAPADVAGMARPVTPGKELPV